MGRANRRWLDLFVAVYLLAAVLIGLLIARGIQVAAVADLELMRQDAQRNAEATATAFDKEIGSYRHLATLFASEQHDFLRRIVTDADPDRHILDLDELAGKWFPSALAFTLTNAEGIPLVSDLKGSIGKVCLDDLQHSARGQLDHAPLHGIGSIPHIDILVPLAFAGGQHGIFMVSFTTASFATALAIPVGLPYQIEFATHHTPSPASDMDFATKSSDVVVRGIVSQDYRDQIGQQLITDMALYVGVFAAFALLGFLALWQARQRILANASELMRVNNELTALALTDPLTGLRNRRSLVPLTITLFAQADREQVAISLALIDIDHFKHINDMLGHASGDACLMATGRLIGEAAQRPLDFTLRYGGEEFLVGWYGTDAEAAHRLATELADRIRALPEKHADGRPLTISAGIVSRQPGETASLEQLLQRADAALYRAKDGGRDRIELA